MICEFYGEGLAYQENLLVKYYAKHGHRVTVVTSTFRSVFDYYSDRYDPSEPPSTYDDSGATIVKVPFRFNLLNRVRPLRGLSRILEEARPDLVFVHNIMADLPEVVTYVRRQPGCRLILDYHADYSNSGKNWLSLKVLHGIIRKRFVDRARPYISKIFPVVPSGAIFLHEVYKVPYAEMEVLPLGADTDMARQVRASNAGTTIRRNLGIPPETFCIFTGGKLTEAKRTHLLIEALELLPELPIYLFVVGGAPPAAESYERRLVELAARTNRVHFAGWVDGEQVYSFMDACDLAVFPASQSVMWQQALSMGLPLIVGQVGVQDCSYMNTHNNIVPLSEEDIRAEVLADQIRRFATDRELLLRSQRGALQVSANLLSYDIIVARTLGV